MLPDLSDDKRMAQTGRLSVLFKARREAAQKLRDKLVPILNSIEGVGGNVWDLEGVSLLLSDIQELNAEIERQKSAP